jgi:hypothetical protein
MLSKSKRREVIGEEVQMSAQQNYIGDQAPIMTRYQDGSAPWVVISDYPTWPSPYFAQFARYAPQGLHLQFKPNIESVVEMDGEVGVPAAH